MITEFITNELQNQKTHTSANIFNKFNTPKKKTDEFNQKIWKTSVKHSCQDIFDNYSYIFNLNTNDMYPTIFTLSINLSPKFHILKVDEFIREERKLDCELDKRTN